MPQATCPVTLVALKKAEPTTMKKKEPALTPSSPGSASGFRVSACMTTPDNARASPTSTANTVRGRRKSRTSSSVVVWPSPVTASMTSRAEMDPEPTNRLSVNAPISTTRPIAMASTLRPALGSPSTTSVVSPSSVEEILSTFSWSPPVTMGSLT
nr:hypothetical protein [Microlunatus phosphovorus]